MEGSLHSLMEQVSQRLEALLVFVWIQDDGNKLRKQKVESMGQIARKRERWRKKEAVLGKSIAPRMETLFPQEQFLLVARGK